ncbi:DUF6443 domain-containing protein [uncultured Tenacibaculum sp.]|uniref:DUF6443 domain-containing protein n=1 Tax=uncultured Tenacibaculum sp. TaxID=174713 RepID=UPI002618851D|nr:DUF6443 domain-containing protein [uncultured Tenacibaculum sp.]
MKKLLYVFLLLSCYSYGQQSIIEKKDYTVTGITTLTATQSITLKPLTWIKPGSTFTAKIVQAPYVPLVFSNENYVFNRTYRKAMTSPSEITSSSDVLESITYFDGLGRTKQSIGIRQGTSGKDIVTHMEYDAFGRQTKEYLPYAATTQNGQIRAGDIATATKSYYQANYSEDFAGVSLPNVNAYSEKELENSPLNRVLKQAAPGQDWRLGGGHEIKFDYQANVDGEVKIFGVATGFANNTYTPSLTGGTAFYPVGTLYKTITKDENWTSGLDHTTEEFKNKQGQVILKRTYNNSQKHDTYYVYDDYGNLTYVLPPKMEGTTASLATIISKLNDLGYQYKYDHRNRLVEKRIPGKGWEYIVYNKLDMPVMTQDANQRTEIPNEWLLTKYDAIGRVAYTGIYNDNSTRVPLQNALYSNSFSQYETMTTVSQNIKGVDVYYTNGALPTGAITIYTINYYDNYVDLPTGLTPTVTTSYGKTSTTNTKGLATVSKVRVLGTNNWITTVTYYDEKARPIYVYSKNDELQTVDIVESKLDDFTGKVIETKAIHKKTGKADIVTVDKFYYDNLDRLTKQTQTIGSNTEVIAENSYDELGQLIEKKVGGKTAQSRLQTVDYKYNVRGWLKNINQDANNDNDLFNFSLKYNDITDAKKRLYNGNISQTSWNTLNTDTSSKTYTYSYDALNRITNATGATTSNYDIGSISYDKNGNILTLVRKGHINSAATTFGNMDVLYYSYDAGNKLTKVRDDGNDIYGFKDGANLGTEYVYDANGNMVRDYNKGIGTSSINGITYNHLNLPTEVKFNNSDAQKISYVYDASGAKLKKVVNNNGNITTTEYAGNYIYENNVLQFFNHPEGYIKKDNTGFKYVYQYKDHLGNVRLSYTDSNNDGVITPSTEIIEESNYYPFGLKHKGYNNVTSSLGNSTAQKFKYNGKELEEELGLNMYEYGARKYMPDLGRWIGVDKKAEKYMPVSPYIYGGNNPVIFIDPNGEDIIIVITGKIVTNAKKEGLISTSRGNYYMYEVNIYDVTSYDDWKASQSGDLIGPVYKGESKTTSLSRDAWGGKKYGKRSSKRYGKNNEAPPGTYYLNYNKDGFGSKKHKLRLSDTKGGHSIVGPDGKRIAIDIHGWSPHDAVGCFTTGCSDKKNKGADGFISLLLSALESGEDIRVIVEERKAIKEVKNGKYTGKYKGVTDKEYEEYLFWKKISDNMEKRYQKWLKNGMEGKW